MAFLEYDIYAHKHIHVDIYIQKTLIIDQLFY